MPESSIAGAAQAILQSRDAALLGAALILVLAVLVWITKQWLSSMKACDTAKEARLADAKEYAQSGESIRNAMQANTEAIRAVLDLLRDQRAKR